MRLQIPTDPHRMHDVKVKVQVHRDLDGRIALFHGPRCLARYNAQGQLLKPKLQTAA
ncbi:hypothetical protein [Thiobacter aerophilum]|uniref:Transposase n=1 Tax=Thiobacter aerophilum TaxID=3121275 RepID=A0ABV0EFV1_9BURK